MKTFLLSTILLFTGLLTGSRAADLLPVQWEPDPIQKYFATTKPIETGTTYRIKIVKLGSAFISTPTVKTDLKVGDVLEDYVSGIFDHKAAIWASGTSDKREIPLSAKKLDSGAWQLTFTRTVLEVKVYAKKKLDF